MEKEEFTLYSVHYHYQDGTWDVDIPARSLKEAEDRLAAMLHTGKVVGVRGMAWLKLKADEFSDSGEATVH